MLTWIGVIALSIRLAATLCIPGTKGIQKSGAIHARRNQIGYYKIRENNSSHW
jgi:hypothetical protein